VSTPPEGRGIRGFAEFVRGRSASWRGRGKKIIVLGFGFATRIGLAQKEKPRVRETKRQRASGGRKDWKNSLLATVKRGWKKTQKCKKKSENSQSEEGIGNRSQED